MCVCVCVATKFENKQISNVGLFFLAYLVHWLFFFFLFFVDREISSAKEQLEREVTSQRCTLQEQRAHIEILDHALGSAQSSVAKFEEEVRDSDSSFAHFAMLW